MNKKYIYLSLAVIGVLLLGILFAFFTQRQSENPRNQSVSRGTENSGFDGSSGPNGTAPDTVATDVPPTQIPLAPVQLLASPEDTAKRFYVWYISTPDPLKSGAYQTRADITDEYKQVMSRYVARGLPADYDPVFNCGDRVLPQTVNALPATLDYNKLQALVILQEVPSGRNAFLIKMKKFDEKWKIRDVWCPPDPTAIPQQVNPT